MLYTEYKIAAERHIEVCLQIQNILEEYKERETVGTLTTTGIKEKNKILSNLYYLSGYIIECSYNCAIYKQLAWTGDVSRLRVSDNSYGVSCNPEASSMFVIRRRGSGVKQHQLSGNMHFFQTVIPITAVSSVPILGYDISSQPCFDLFDNWNAEIRYTIDSSLNLDYNNVFDFFFTAVKVFEELLKNSMI